MHKGVYTVVDGLRRGLISRNKQFLAFETPEARRARRVHRRLIGLSRELLAPGVAVALDPPPAAGAPFILTLLRAEVRLRRVAYLAREELRLLCDDPRVRARLRYR